MIRPPPGVSLRCSCARRWLRTIWWLRVCTLTASRVLRQVAAATLNSYSEKWKWRISTTPESARTGEMNTQVEAITEVGVRCLYRWRFRVRWVREAVRASSRPSRFEVGYRRATPFFAKINGLVVKSVEALPNGLLAVGGSSSTR